ncbi:hypothetical protein IWW50_004337, partial [Coemansia erecta]
PTQPHTTQRVSVFASKDTDDLDAEWTEELALKEASDKKKRNLDTFLEELKHGQEQREGRRKTKRKGSGEPADGDSGDPKRAHGLSTNLYISGLHPDVDEQALGAAFARHGAVGSVKIMWPRTAEEAARGRNSGFVSFMERAGAEAALQAMDSAELHGVELRVVWGKHVVVPEEPMFVQGGSGRLQTGLPFNAQGAGGSGGIAEVRVVRPADTRTVRLIHWTVEHVVRFGPQFELALVSRARGDPRFRFLADMASAEHVYYRWRMYSLLSGDTKAKWRDRMFLMHDEGAVWEPPAVVDDARLGGSAGNISDAESSAAEERRSGGALRDTLGRRARDRLERRVRRVQGSERGAIAAAMASAVEHAYAAAQVVEIVCQALNDAAAPAEKLAKLLLVSDILHNSSAPVANAWRLRENFEPRLADMFDGLAAAYRRIDARLKAEHFRKRVLAVLAVWEAWMVFPLDRICDEAAKFM